MREVRSEIAASVWKVQVTAGASVEEGDVLVILESMKMEIPVEAPATGTVSEIMVGEGDTVDEGQLLALLDG